MCAVRLWRGAYNGTARHDLQNTEIVMWLFLQFLVSAGSWVGIRWQGAEYDAL